MLLMGVSTFAVGLLPTYAQVGVLAPVMLVVLRLVQGFAVAGELGGASAMIVEHAPFGRRGYFASFALQGTQAGRSSPPPSCSRCRRSCPTEAFLSWGWRIPFLLSVVVVIWPATSSASGSRSPGVRCAGGEPPPGPAGSRSSRCCATAVANTLRAS